MDIPTLIIIGVTLFMASSWIKDSFKTPEINTPKINTTNIKESIRETANNPVSIPLWMLIAGLALLMLIKK